MVNDVLTSVLILGAYFIFALGIGAVFYWLWW